VIAFLNWELQGEIYMTQAKHFENNGDMGCHLHKTYMS